MDADRKSRIRLLGKSSFLVNKSAYTKMRYIYEKPFFRSTFVYIYKNGYYLTAPVNSLNSLYRRSTITSLPDGERYVIGVEWFYRVLRSMEKTVVEGRKIIYHIFVEISSSKGQWIVCVRCDNIKK